MVLKGFEAKMITFVIFILLIGILIIGVLVMNPDFLYNLGSMFVSLSRNAISSVAFT